MIRSSLWSYTLAGAAGLMLAASAASAQSTTQPARPSSPKDAKAALKAQTAAPSAVSGSLKGAAKATAGAPAVTSSGGKRYTGKSVVSRTPISARKPVVQAPPGTIPPNIPDAVAHDATVDPDLSSPAGALTGTVDQNNVPDLGDEFEYVPMPGGTGGKKEIKGGYTHTIVRERHSRPAPVVHVNVEKEPGEPEPKVWPKVWVVPVGANVSPTTGNLLSDGFVQYDRGPQRIAHRIGNEIWNFKDRKVRLSVDDNRGIQFQVVAELQGQTRRLVLKTDNLVGPRPLPADKCVTISRVWYTRGKHGREPDSWWDSPATLVPIFKPLIFPSEDNTVPGQTNQAFVVTIYIPKLVLSGVYRTTLHVMDLDDPTYYDNIQVEISAQPDGKKLRSVIG